MPLLIALSVTLLTSWGSLYYAFAVLAPPIQAELGWSAQLTAGAYSLALLVSGLSAFPIGRFIDRRGGRGLMAFGSLLAAALFIALSQVTSIYVFYALWIGLGAAMAMTLYEPAFAVIVAAYPHDFRKRIGILTLAGGLASTVFWPLTHVLVTHFGWRDAALALGALNLLLCAPLHWLTVPARTVRGAGSAAADATPAVAAPAPAAPATAASPPRSVLRSALRTPSFWLLSLSFMAWGFVTAAMAVHVIAMLETRGLATTAAVGIAALIGPMQLTGRALEVALGARVPPLVVGGVTVALMPLGLAILLFSSAPALLYVFVVCYGAGLGLSTLVRATTPAALFGREGYASVAGALSGPALLARAAGPVGASATLAAFHAYDAVLVLVLGSATLGAVSYWLAVGLRSRAAAADATQKRSRSALA